jgi:hypothetical protein
MAITFIGASSTPTDGGSNTAISGTITYPAGIQNGDLVFMYLLYRGTGVQNSAGFNTHGVRKIANLGDGSQPTSYSPAWFIYNSTFNTGSSFLFQFSAAAGGGSTNTTMVLLVFRPTSTLYTFVPYIAKSSGLSQEIYLDMVFNGTTTTSMTAKSGVPVNSVVIATWNTADDNTWGTLTGTGWSKTGLANQYRNIGGSDSSITFAYYFTATGTFGQTTSVPAVSQTQLTLGADQTQANQFLFTEVLITDLQNRNKFFHLL